MWSPTAPRKAHDARHWRLKALEAFATAETMTDPECRAVMVKIGVGYDRMADLIESGGFPAPSKGSRTKP
jgi:hypothetical protein